MVMAHNTLQAAAACMPFFHASNRFRNDLLKKNRFRNDGVLVFSKAKHYVFFHTSNRFRNNGVLVFSK
jgi:hypothetical protein